MLPAYSVYVHIVKMFILLDIILCYNFDVRIWNYTSHWIDETRKCFLLLLGSSLRVTEYPRKYCLTKPLSLNVLLILKELILSFYFQFSGFCFLYSNKDDPLSEMNLKEYLKEGDVPKLSENESNQIEGYLTLSELSKALRNMKHNKSLGTDGYSCEFFKEF